MAISIRFVFLLSCILLNWWPSSAALMHQGVRSRNNEARHQAKYESYDDDADDNSDDEDERDDDGGDEEETERDEEESARNVRRHDEEEDDDSRDDDSENEDDADDVANALADAGNTAASIRHPAPPSPKPSAEQEEASDVADALAAAGAAAASMRHPALLQGSNPHPSSSASALATSSSIKKQVKGLKLVRSTQPAHEVQSTQGMSTGDLKGNLPPPDEGYVYVPMVDQLDGKSLQHTVPAQMPVVEEPKNAHVEHTVPTVVQQSGATVVQQSQPTGVQQSGDTVIRQPETAVAQATSMHVDKAAAVVPSAAPSPPAPVVAGPEMNNQAAPQTEVAAMNFQAPSAAQPNAVKPDELAANLKQQKELEKRIKVLSNQSASDKQIEDEAATVAKQTESKALAEMLSKMWKDMRTFGAPAYTKHAEDELAQLKIKEKQLENHYALKKDSAKPKSTNQKPSPQAAGASGANFWALNSAQKEQYLVGSLSYIITGIILAILYKKASGKYPNHFRAKPANDVFRESKQQHFSFGIFDCVAAPKICVLGCCCTGMRWADNMAWPKNALMAGKYWQAFLIFLLLTALTGYTFGLSYVALIIVGVRYRQKLRRTYDMESGTKRSIALDALSWIFCQPCAIIQEAREESAHEPITAADQP